MTVVEVEEIAESVDYGVTATTRSSGPKMLRITDIQDGQVNWQSVPSCTPETKGVEKCRLQQGDIVFARTGATTGKSFLIHECPEDSVFASYLIRLRLKAGVAHPAYVSHYFKSHGYWNQITTLAKGVAQPGVNATSLKRVRLPLPSLAEQRRIASILDAAEALQSTRRQAVAKLETLAQSTFTEMFGDVVQNTQKWKSASLAEFCERIQIGPFGSQLHQSDYVQNGIPLINPLHIVDGELKPQPDQTVAQESYGRLKNYWLQPGDVVLGRRGEMGRCAVVNPDCGPLLCGSGSLFLRPNLDVAVAPYISAALSSRPGRSYLERVAKGVTMMNLSGEAIKQMTIALPPISLQRSFEERMQDIDKLVGDLTRSSNSIDDLFASLQQRAFRGEL